LDETIADAATDAIANVRKLGRDMRDDWTIVLSFKSAAKSGA
jgi:hypothetical protein